MRVGQLKQLLEFIDDDVEVLIEVGIGSYECYAYEDNIAVTGEEVIIVRSKQLDEEMKS